MQSLESLLLVRKAIRKGQSKKALESYQAVFDNLSYDLKWLAKQKSEANFELADFIKSCNKAFRQEAVKSMTRILAKTDGACNYSNPA